MDEPISNPDSSELAPPLGGPEEMIEPTRQAPPQSLEPVTKASRIAEMDIVRGIAILGVFLINMPLFNAPASAFFQPGWVTGWWPEWNHQAALWFINTFAQGKFYTLFSFLFGMGFGVQMLRAMEKGDEVLFYHTGDEKAVIGIASVIRTAYPDATATEGEWSVVDLAPIRALRRAVTLAEIKKDSRLKDIVLVRQSRLSVMPIGAKEFQMIVKMSS